MIYNFKLETYNAKTTELKNIINPVEFKLFGLVDINEVGLIYGLEENKIIKLDDLLETQTDLNLLGFIHKADVKEKILLVMYKNNAPKHILLGQTKTSDKPEKEYFGDIYFGDYIRKTLESTLEIGSMLNTFKTITQDYTQSSEYLKTMDELLTRNINNANEVLSSAKIIINLSAYKHQI